MRLVVNLKVQWREGRSELRLDLLLPRPDEGGHREREAAWRHRRAHRHPRHQAEAGAGDGEHGSRSRPEGRHFQRTCRKLHADPPRLGSPQLVIFYPNSPCVYTPVPPQRILCKPRRLPRFRCLNTPQHPSQRRQPFPALATLPHATAQFASCVLRIPPPVFYRPTQAADTPVCL